MKIPSNASSNNSPISFSLRFGQNLLENQSGGVESRGMIRFWWHDDISNRWKRSSDISNKQWKLLPYSHKLAVFACVNMCMWTLGGDIYIVMRLIWMNVRMWKEHKRWLASWVWHLGIELEAWGWGPLSLIWSIMKMTSTSCHHDEGLLSWIKSNSYDLIHMCVWPPCNFVISP